jgi:hypothetical protein
VTRVLRDVAGEDGDEEGGCCAADHRAGRLLPRPEQSSAEGESVNTSVPAINDTPSITTTNVNAVRSLRLHKPRTVNLNTTHPRDASHRQPRCTVGPRPRDHGARRSLRRAWTSTPLSEVPRAEALARGSGSWTCGPVPQGQRPRGVTHGCCACSSRLFYSGPEMPPSLRTRQKWMAMKITMMNGNSSTCSTYQRNSVSVPISEPPSSTNRTWSPNTGV